jgi:hypothetical protein
MLCVVLVACVCAQADARLATSGNAQRVVQWIRDNLASWAARPDAAGTAPFCFFSYICYSLPAVLRAHRSACPGPRKTDALEALAAATAAPAAQTAPPAAPGATLKARLVKAAKGSFRSDVPALRTLRMKRAALDGTRSQTD